MKNKMLAAALLCSLLAGCGRPPKKVTMYADGKPVRSWTGTIVFLGSKSVTIEDAAGRQTTVSGDFIIEPIGAEAE